MKPLAEWPTTSYRTKSDRAYAITSHDEPAHYIAWHELTVLREQCAKPSDAYAACVAHERELAK